MADRTVSVRLKADVDAYNRSILEAKAVTESLDRSVNAVERDIKELTPETVRASKATEQLGVEAGKAKTQTKGLGDEIGKTKDKTTGLGEESGKTRAKIVTLAEEITKTKAALAEMGEEFRRTGKVNVDELNKLSSGLRDLERARAAVEMVTLGDDAENARTKIVNLTKDIDRTKLALKEMGDEFRRSGGIDIGEFKSLQRRLHELGLIKTALEELAPAAAAVTTGLLDFALDEWILDGLRSAAGHIDEAWGDLWKVIANNPAVSTAVIVGITAGLPVATALIGGAMASAVNLGIGGGVLALGISRAVADTRVAAAWSGLSDTATDALDKSAGRFVEPLIHSAHRFEAAFVGDVMPRIDSAFEALAPKLAGLTEGAIGFARNVGPGFDDAVAAAGPFIDLLSEHLPEIGASISSFLGHLNNAGPGAEQFFHDLLTWTEGGIRTIGWLVEKGSEVYQLFTALGLLIQGDFKGAWETWSDGIVALASGADKGEQSFGGFKNKTVDVNVALGLLDGTVTRLGDGTLVAAGDFAGLSKMLGETAATADTVAGLMAGKLFDSMMSLDQAALGFAQSQTQVGESIKQNGLQLDIHTVKGQTNTGAILGAVQANMAQYQANIAVGMAAGDAAKAYDVNTAALEHQLRQAGFTQGAIDGLIGKYRNVPGKVNTDIATNGLTTAIENLDDLIRRINNIPTRRDIYITEHLSTVGGFSYKSPDRLFDYPAGRYGAITSFAQGGVAPGIYQTMSGQGIFKFAEPETGGEAYIPRNVNRGRAMDLASVVGDWHGFDVVPRGAPSPGYAQFANTRPMGGGGITNITTVTIPVTAGMGTNEYRLGQQIAEALGPFVENNGGSVQMAIVGRQVT